MRFLVVVYLVFSAYALANRHHGLGFFDSTEYSSHIADSGVPHAPGYPVYTMLGKIFHALGCEPFTAQFAVSMLSLAAVLFFTYRTFKRNEEDWTPFAAQLVGLVFISGYWIKLYTLLPEVFILNCAIFAAFFDRVDAWFRSASPRAIFGVFFVYGIGFCHHHTLALTLPGVLWLIWQKYFAKESEGFGAGLKALPWAVGGALAGVTPLAYMFIASNPMPDYTYYSVENFDDLLFMVLRRGYGTWSLTVFQDAAPLSDVFELVLKGVAKNFNYVGLLVFLPFALFPGDSGQRWRRNPVLVVSWTTLALFFLFFVPKNNIPFTFEKYKQVVLRFVTVPAVLLLYPAYEALRIGFKRWSAHAPKIFWGAVAVLTVSNAVGWDTLKFRDLTLLQTQIEKGFETIREEMDPATSIATSVNPQYMKCAIFTRPDAMVFATRYYNQFLAQKRCFMFTTASFSNQFRGKNEEMLVRMTFGPGLMDFMNQTAGNSANQLRILFERLKASGFRIFLFYPTDSVVFANTGFRMRPVGNIQELILEGTDPYYPPQNLLVNQAKYLQFLETYLNNLRGKSYTQMVLDESVTAGLFLNLEEYRRLTSAAYPQNPQLGQLDARVTQMRFDLFGEAPAVRK